MGYTICLFILLIILGLVLSISVSGFANYIAPYGSPSQKDWWKKQGWERFGYPYYSYWETFENPAPAPVNPEKKENPVMEYPPDSPSPADLSIRTPYHLLGDEISPPREKESLSCVNSRSCYATDFGRMVEKTGNYRQLTNNFKRGYPDSCSAPYQEMVLNFYKADSIPLPPS
jgi:hypothetical protein